MNMISRIKQIAWRLPVFRQIIYFASYLKNYIFYSIVFYCKVLFRQIDRNNPYQRLSDYRNKYKGQRCFIIATGPSLTISDVAMLKNEITFGMNSLCLMFEELGWETTFYGVQDEFVYDKLKSEINKLQSTKLLVGDIIFNSDKGLHDKIPFSVNLMNHHHTYKKLKTDFSTRPDRFVYDGYTITYSLIQIAVFMGFKDIYLLGNDCNYSTDPKKQHFKDYGLVDSSASDAGRRILFAYEYAREVSKNSGFTIFNATRGGKLELFQRVKLEDVI